MSDINYNDLHKVYQGIYTQPVVAEEVVAEDEFEEYPLQVPQTPPPAPRVRPEIIETRVVMPNPLCSEAMGYWTRVAVGCGIARWLGMI